MQNMGETGGNVIDMTGMMADNRFRSLIEVEAYWEALRDGGGVPRRSDIDPRGIQNALEYAFILERIAPGLARLRIAGMHLSDLMGMEVRGMPVSAFIPPSGRNGFADTLDAVMTRPATARITLSAETGIGKPPLEGRMLLLPLVSDMGDISRVLGCFETQGPLGRAPRRFDILHTELTPVAQGQDLPEAPAPARPRRRPPEPVTGPLGFGEARPSFQRPAPGGKQPGYLRLVRNDD